MVNYEITKGKMGDRPKVTLPNPEFLQILGEDGFMQLIDKFYETVIESDIAFFFPQEEDEIEFIKKRNGAYFMQMCGGKDTYTANGGTFDQVKVHEQFSIPDKARYEWLGCWEDALKPIESTIDHNLIQSYWNWLEAFSKHMINFELDKRDEEELVKQ